MLANAGAAGDVLILGQEIWREMPTLQYYCLRHGQRNLRETTVHRVAKNGKTEHISTLMALLTLMNVGFCHDFLPSIEMTR